MAQIKILDKEKDYLLSVSAQGFVDGLNSASIFYELLSYDTLGTLKERKEAKTSYNNITLVSVYNYLLNLVCYNMYEGLSFRHHILYKKQDKKLELNSIWLRISSINYLDEEMQRRVNPTDDIFQEYEYLFTFASSWRSKTLTINDKINFSLRTFSIFEHSISITKQQISDDFLPKMLILYQDFADNIPI
jgi:hypothetical protein